MSSSSTSKASSPNERASRRRRRSAPLASAASPSASRADSRSADALPGTYFALQDALGLERGLLISGGA